ncbi:T9SS type A sorting domain-containing protein [Bacteroidota bacterium]
MKKSFLFIFFIAIMGMGAALAQTLTLDSYGVSPRDVERDTVLQYFDRAYNGLLNVGVETKMYFRGHFEDSTLSTPMWTLFIKPVGSSAAIGTTLDMDASTQVASLIPDIVGTYKVAFSDGMFADTVTINAGLYLGVEGGAVNCIGCHNTSIWDFKYDKWLETGHSNMLVRGLNGTLSSHYAGYCISCHTVGYDPDAANDGFDDFPFVFPDSLFPGQFDLMTAAYPDAMARANIQCESCHGPGSAHLGIISNSKISKTLSTDNCAWCHDSGTHHAFPEQWDHSGDDATNFDGRGFHGGHAIGTWIARGTRSGCAPCHSGAGYVQWNYEGRPVDGNGLPDDIETVPEATTHTCATCHDPHDATNIHQLRFQDTQLGDGAPITFELYGTGSQCMECHRSRRNGPEYSSDIENASSHYGPHHGPQADMLIGANAPDFGVQLPSSPHSVATENACVDCHMAGELTDPEGNINLVGGHSWNMNDAEGNDHIEACAPCHGTIGTSFKDKKYYINGNADLDGNGTAEGLQLEVHGILEMLAELLPHDEDGDVSITEDNADSVALTPEIMRAGYVYFWIEEDRSFGIHNPAFTVSLLKAAIEEMGGVVSVEYPESGIVSEYKLSQNYPNPFNPTTTIEFTLPEQSDVTITVYDAIGTQLDVLFSGAKDAGVHKVNWNASSYASGIYFYRMNTEKFVKVNKMILLK